MLCDLIIDGNYLLNRIVFTLHKNNLLFGNLNKSLHAAILKYRRIYPFVNVYLVSDSKEKSWRKKFLGQYKATRRKDSDIDWEFVFNGYNEFKDEIKTKNIKILEAPEIEGDDWISYLVRDANTSNRSSMIISNDHDIKQLISWNLNPPFINIMSNDLMIKQRVFLPKGYKVFVDGFKKITDNTDIFDLNDNSEFIKLIESFQNDNEIQEVDPMESLIIKLISGDNSDNIDSAWSVSKNGKKRGIADRGAKTIFDQYVVTFGEPSIDDPDLAENIADLICEKKKLSRVEMDKIESNIKKNKKLIHLNVDNFPKEIIARMDQTFQNLKQKND